MKMNWLRRNSKSNRLAEDDGLHETESGVLDDPAHEREELTVDGNRAAHMMYAGDHIQQFHQPQHQQQRKSKKMFGYIRSRNGASSPSLLDHKREAKALKKNMANGADILDQQSSCPVQMNTEPITEPFSFNNKTNNSNKQHQSFKVKKLNIDKMNTSMHAHETIDTEQRSEQNSTEQHRNVVRQTVGVKGGFLSRSPFGRSTNKNIENKNNNNNSNAFLDEIDGAVLPVALDPIGVCPSIPSYERAVSTQARIEKLSAVFGYGEARAGSVSSSPPQDPGVSQSGDDTMFFGDSSGEYSTDGQIIAPDVVSAKAKGRLPSLSRPSFKSRGHTGGLSNQLLMN